MKKLLAIFISMMLLASVSAVIVGCKDKAEQDVPRVEAPVVAPAPEVTPEAPEAVTPETEAQSAEPGA